MHEHSFSASIDWTGNTGRATSEYHSYERSYDIATDGKITVTKYLDRASGVMTMNAGGGGRFTKVALQPVVTFAAETDLAKAEALHRQAHAKCFIANSVNFPIEHVSLSRTET